MFERIVAQGSLWFFLKTKMNNNVFYFCIIVFVFLATAYAMRRIRTLQREKKALEKKNELCILNHDGRKEISAHYYFTEIPTVKEAFKKFFELFVIYSNSIENEVFREKYREAVELFESKLFHEDEKNSFAVTDVCRCITSVFINLNHSKKQIFDFTVIYPELSLYKGHLVITLKLGCGIEIALSFTVDHEGVLSYEPTSIPFSYLKIMFEEKRTEDVKPFFDTGSNWCNTKTDSAEFLEAILKL